MYLDVQNGGVFLKIVIIGGGKVGEAICRELGDSCDIVLVDTDPDVIEDIFNHYDIQAVVGNGGNVDILKEAGVEDSDVFLAVTSSDELNIISCIIAQKLGSKHTIARVRNPEYNMSVDFIKSSLGIDHMINPEEESADIISEILKFPTAQSIEVFANGKVNMVEVLVRKGAYLEGMNLIEFDKASHGKLIVCILERDNDVMIPSGDTVLMEGDIIHVTGSPEDLDKFYCKIRKFKSPIKSIMIVGGGRICHYLLRKLADRNMDIKVIEMDKEIAIEMSKDFPEAMIINADGTDQEILESEGISEYDCCIAMTGIDEENIIISLYAKYRNVKKCIAKVSRTSMLQALDQAGLDTIITPKRIIADKIVRFVRSIGASRKSEVEELYTLAQDRVEALQFKVSKSSELVGKPLQEIKIKKGTLVAFILRGDELIFPGGDDIILPDDRVAIVTTQENIGDLDDILE